jgi:hypothetical protein
MKPKREKKDWQFLTSRDFWADESIRLDQKGLIMVIASYANSDLQAWPTKEQIKKRSGICLRKMWDMMQDLREKGFISWVEFRDEQGRARNRYTLLPPCKICVMGKGKPTMQNVHDDHHADSAR